MPTTVNKAQPNPAPSDTTLRLSAYQPGQGSTSPALLRAGRAELRRLVRRLLERGESAPPIEPTAVVNEVSRRLLGAGGVQDLTSRGEFFADLAGAFRRTLRRRALAAPTTNARFDLPSLGVTPLPLLEQAIGELEQERPRQAEVAILRLLGAMTDAEIACKTDTAERQVAADGAGAEAWLRRRLANNNQ